jgi:hypothetical protein
VIFLYSGSSSKGEGNPGNSMFVPIYAKDQVGKAVKESLARLVSSHRFEE